MGKSVYTSPIPKLSVEPSSIININMVPPTTFTINITIKDVTDLYSFNFSLNYSTTVLTATAVTLGSFFPPNSKSWKEDINDALGYVRYVVTLPLGTLPGGGLNGSGTLATIDFTVDDLGETVLDLCNTKLGDSQPKYIPRFYGRVSRILPKWGRTTNNPPLHWNRTGGGGVNGYRHH